MRDMFEEFVTEEIIKEVEDNITFVDMPNLRNYDTITIFTDFIEIAKDAKYKMNDNLEYIKIRNKEVRQFKKDDLSGVFVEC